MELETALQVHRHDKIALYGLSPLTGTLLKRLDGFWVVGLLDGYQTSGELYGKPIFSMQEALDSGVRLIVVAARPESCKVIAKRIGALCAEHGIALLDIHGNDLCASPKVAYSFAGVQGVSKETLRQLIQGHDVVSVDFFDTLLTRRTLFPSDVFELVGQRLEQRGVEIEDFPLKRLEGEKELGKTTVPTLLEIYSYMVERHAVTGIQAEALARLEWETDRELLVPREELCALLREVFQRGKPLYIVSDTFYTEEQLAVFLRDWGIGYTEILTSCDYRTGKAQQLFARLWERIPGRSCLHIGDSVDADVEGAERNGCTACRLYSGLELFEKAGYLGLWENIHSLHSRIQAGMLAARLFNSPFQFEEPGCGIHVTDAYEVGYVFFGPVITGFVIWLYRQMREQGLKNLWFCARDGYLIKKLYDQLDGAVKSTYFLTSRFAAVRAGIETEEDLRYVEEMRFSGSLQEQLQERFGISIEKDRVRGGLLDYKEEILEAAKASRRGYLRYMESLPWAEGDVAFYDFVARGTVQMYIGRLTERRLRGFYFWQQDRELMREKGLDIQTFFKPEERTVSQYYLVLENVLMAPQPSVLGFDGDGRACFAAETRTERELRCIQKVQEGISDYVQAYLKLAPGWESTEENGLEASILSLMREIEIRDGDFLALKDEDPFFHRTTAVSDLI